MRTRTRLAVSFASAALLWAVFSWPLAMHVLHGVPSSAENTESGHVRTMIHGDHLQLMYHFWLAGRMVTGQTKLFHNVYEFNLGNDSDRELPGAYFIPFSLVSYLFAAVGGRALGWNATALISLWLAVLAAWRLCERFGAERWSALLWATVGLALPAQWGGMLGGSPAGFAAPWVPAMCLGVDYAVRDRRWGGGVTAGLAMLAAAWTDTHVFFFSVLSLPFWCLFSASRDERFPWLHPRRWWPALRPLLPVAGLVLLALGYVWVRHTLVWAKSAMGAGRDYSEVALYSPFMSAFFTHGRSAVDKHVFVGFGLFLVIFLGLAAMLWRATARRAWRPALLAVLLLLGMAGVLFLATGVNGPMSGGLFVAARKFVPPYRMIRQPAKIFSLMPTLVALAGAVTSPALLAGLRRPGRRRALQTLVALAILVELRAQLNPTVCLLDSRQGAYGAVAAHARGAGREPHVLAVPLWPGDAAWSSLYLHYASLYGIRLVNGYSPAVPKHYFEEGFRRFESVNKGRLTAAQRVALHEMGVHYVVLHENAFPEKVSPLPVAFTLRNLLNDPWLELLEREGSVWAFALRDRPRERPGRGGHWRTFFPSRRWEFELCRGGDGRVAADDGASRGHFVSLDEPGVSVETSARPRPPYTVWAPGLRWLVRARGRGALAAVSLLDGESLGTVSLPVDNDAWSWLGVPVPAFEGHAPLSLRLVAPEGGVEADAALLHAGPWPTPAPGDRITLPAPTFFHAGYTDLEDDAVVLRPDYEAERSFYGPLLPVPAGHYEATLEFASEAAAGTRLGVLTAEVDGRRLAAGDVVAGRPAAVRFRVPASLPLRLDFVFARTAQVRLRRAVLDRLD